jgi:hypothetical protein
MIMTMIAYVLVVPLAQFCLTAGVLVGGFPVALLLAWAPISIRTKIAGVCGGVIGVAFAVAFGYGVFRLFVGSGSFTICPFLASSLPLLLPIRNDIIQAMRVREAREQLLATIAGSRDEGTMSTLATETMTAHGSGVVGEIVGLVLAALWFFSR